MTSTLYAISGIALAVLLTFALGLIKPQSGDPIIQPEGEPDPGKRM
jgi:hypothetical protein